MATDEEKAGNGMRISSSDGAGWGRFKRFVLTVLILAAIVLITGVFAVRTEGGRDFIESRLEKRLGLPLTVERVRIEFPYTLAIEGIEAETADADSRPDLRIGELRFRAAWRSGWRWSVSRGELTLRQVSAREWEPRAFARLGDLPFRTIAELSRITERLRQHAALELRDGSIRWLDVDGVVLAQADGVSFDMAPVELPRRCMTAYALRVYSARDLDGNAVHDLEREWLASKERPYVEIYRSDREVARQVASFWDAEPRTPVSEAGGETMTAPGARE